MSMKNWNLDPLALWSAWLKILDAQAKIAQDNQTNRLEILTGTVTGMVARANAPVDRLDENGVL